MSKRKLAQSTAPERLGEIVLRGCVSLRGREAIPLDRLGGAFGVDKMARWTTTFDHTDYGAVRARLRFVLVPTVGVEPTTF